MELVPFYTMFAPVVGKDLAGLLADGCSYSLPVSMQRAGRLFDALFLYKPEDGPTARPTGWVLMDSCTGRLAVLADCEIMDFAVPDLLPPDVSVESHLKDLTPKKLAALRAQTNDVYDEMRAFAFSDELNGKQQSIVDEYKRLFLKLSAPGHYPFYYALSPGFFHWLRMPLPVHKASVSPDENAVLEDPARRLMLENIQKLANDFEEKLKTDSHKNAMLDEMHAELQEYKKGMLDNLTLSMELDVIKLIDDVERSVAAFSGKPATDENYSRLYAMLAGVSTDLEDLLYRHGVEPYRVDGDSVDVKRQKVLNTVPTGDVSQDKKTARRLARGWEKQGRIIRQERISAYLYREENNQ